MLPAVSKFVTMLDLPLLHVLLVPLAALKLRCHSIEVLLHRYPLAPLSCTRLGRRFVLVSSSGDLRYLFLRLMLGGHLVPQQLGEFYQ